MKKILSLLALMMLCVTGANAEKVIYSWPSDASQANSITLAEGVTVAITGNTSKNIQNANKITVNGTEYTSMKVSNGAQNTLTLPKEAIGITFYSYVNKDAATDRAPYWKEVAGVEYTEETSGGTMTSYKDGANPDIRSFSFEATKELTFTNTGEQLCYVMEVEYAESAVPEKAVFLIPNAWDVADATERYAAWAWAGELGAWFDFTNYNGVYAAAIPASCTELILVRMDGETTENNWDNKWNQTADIAIADLADNTVFTMTSIEGAYTTTPFSELIDKAREAMKTFDNVAAEVLESDLAALEEELAKEVKDFDAIKAKIKTLVNKAEDYIKADIAKVKGYAVDIADDVLDEDIAAIEEANEAKDFAKLIASMQDYENDFVGVAERYVAKAKAINTEGKEGAAKLESAISAVDAQLEAESLNIMQLGLAVRNLVIAMRAFEEANTIYTVAGNIEAIFGTAWDTENTANDMTKGADGIWTKVYENIALEPCTIEYKVVKNHTWDVAYGFDGNNATYEIKSAGTAETITFTFDPATESVSCTVKMADSDLMAEARALAAEDGVAVGKLLQAIEYAEAGDETGLQAAIDQYKEDNKDQEKDETAKVATNGWKKYDGTAAGVCATQFAPAITTYDGRENVQLAEVYEGNADGVNRTGTIIYQDITGLTNGKYKVGFYGNAFFTSGRGFESPMADGAEDVAYVFANDEKEFIVANIATSTTENNFRQFDVEVTDGTIKLGMGKEKAGTNWHTMQIYQLTWFTTAKEVFAADQEELKALLAEANALLADETKTEGRDGFEIFVKSAEQAVDSKMINITELENVIGNLKSLIAGFKKSNWYIDLAAGEYYIIDAETDLKMAAGNNYGTRGIVNEMGLDLTLTPYTESRTVTFDSRVSNGGDNHFLGSNLYMDSSEWGWALEYKGFGFYIIEPNSEKYINLDADNNLVLSDTPREWIIVSKEGVMEERLEELKAATAEAPVDATFLLTAPNFNRNDARNAEAWTVSEDCTNKNLSGGNQTNNCAESFHSVFTISQTISNAPAGLYKLTAQGFYRQDDYEGDEAPAAPEFFIGCKKGEVPAKTGIENSMSDASASFTNGQYTIEPIEFKHFAAGDLVVGVKATVDNQWVIFDNFKLEYCGPATAEFYVAGIYDAEEADEEDFIFGTAWAPTLNKMELGGPWKDNNYYFIKEKVDLKMGKTIYYKVVADGDWDYSWGFGEDNGNFVIGTDDFYDVVIQFNPAELLDNGYNVNCWLEEGGTTGISDIAAETKAAEGIYTLSGQKVLKATKGLYIINGKKVMVK